jgi:hypothetical protein
MSLCPADKSGHLLRAVVSTQPRVAGPVGLTAQATSSDLDRHVTFFRAVIWLFRGTSFGFKNVRKGRISSDIDGYIVFVVLG